MNLGLRRSYTNEIPINTINPTTWSSNAMTPESRLGEHNQAFRNTLYFTSTNDHQHSELQDTPPTPLFLYK